MKKMWKSLILPHIDYCSPVWHSPQNAGELEKLERLQRNFTRRIPEVKHLNYWERLRSLKMLSIQRRLERYSVLLTWKCLEGHTTNCGISAERNLRRGRLCVVPPLPRRTSSTLNSLKDNSFQVFGPIRFNSLLRELRDISGCSPKVFKDSLDRYLSLMPDEPKTESLTPRGLNQVTLRPSNRITDMSRITELPDEVKRLFETRSSLCNSPQANHFTHDLYTCIPT